MSDPRMPQGMPTQGARPGMGNAQQAAGAIRANRSIFHPTDMAAMQQTGDVSQTMTIAQFFSKFGIDVNKDPVSRLAQFTRDQLAKANPVNKMSAIAGGSPAPSPGTGTPDQTPAAPPPGLNDIMSKLGG